MRSQTRVPSYVLHETRGHSVVVRRGRAQGLLHDRLRSAKFTLHFSMFLRTNKSDGPSFPSPETPVIYVLSYPTLRISTSAKKAGKRFLVLAKLIRSFRRTFPPTPLLR